MKHFLKTALKTLFLWIYYLISQMPITCLMKTLQLSSPVFSSWNHLWFIFCDSKTWSICILRNPHGWTQLDPSCPNEWKKKDGLLCSFYNQNYDFGDYVFRVVSTGETIDRSWRSDTINYKHFYLNTLEMTPFRCNSELLYFVLDHYTNMFNYTL